MPYSWVEFLDILQERQYEDSDSEALQAAPGTGSGHI